MASKMAQYGNQPIARLVDPEKHPALVKMRCVKEGGIFMVRILTEPGELNRAGQRIPLTAGTAVYECPESGAAWQRPDGSTDGYELVKDGDDA